MKRTFLLFSVCVFLVAITRVQSQNITTGGPGKTDNHFTEGWQLISSGVDENLQSVHFSDHTHGFIGGALTRCLKTTNGGLNWSSVAVPSYADFNSVWTASSNDAFLGGWDTVYTTHNGGQSWQGAYTQTVNYAIFDLQFIGSDNGFAFMTWAQMGKTNDGGNNWSLAAGAGFTAWDFFGGHMLDQNNGYAVGDNQLLCKTTDGGDNFQVYEWNGYLDFTGIRIQGVFAASDLIAIAVADSGVVFRTTDGGNYWSRHTIAGPEDNLMDIHFINANTGYIVGYNGKIFKTSDGGENWIQEPLITDNHLNSVFFISENLGWAVGDFGTILRYEGTNSVHSDSKKSNASDVLIYPSPVTEESSISLILSEKESVMIDIRESSGKVLDVLFDGPLLPGKHIIPLNLRELCNGYYICCLTSRSGIICKPFVVAR